MKIAFRGPVTFSVAIAAVLSGCGSKKDTATTIVSASAVELVADPSMTGSVVNASHGDAVSSTSDQSSSGASLALSGGDDLKDGKKSKDNDDDQSSVTKTCAVSGNNAVVTLSSSINRSKSSSSKSGTVTVERSRTGTSALTRTWSRTDGTAVTCNTAGNAANVNLQSPSGVKLDIKFERAREDKMTYTGPSLTRTSSKSFSSKGTRSVTWNSNSAASDTSETYTRTKQIVIKDVEQDLTMTNKEGKTFSSSLSIDTAEDQPLVVTVERNKLDHSIVYKTIVSGKIITKKDADATITTTYASLKMDSECKPVSGNATIVITDATGTTLKTLTLDADSSSGEGALKDSGGTQVEGFHLDDCDSEDKH